MKTLIRLARRLLRRPAPAYRGWQDLELGKYVTDPEPADLVVELPITLPEMPDILPWQEDLLRHCGWLVRDRMLQEHRRPEDARITICGDPAPEHVGLQVWGIPVRFDPMLPVDRMDVEFRDRFSRIRAVHTPLPDGGWSVEEIN